MILYLFQLTLGVVIHFAKTPSFMGGRRPPQNYLHAFLGLVIIALAFYQVHYGITIEWYEATIGSGTIVPASALHAWTALIVVSPYIAFYLRHSFNNGIHFCIFRYSGHSTQLDFCSSLDNTRKKQQYGNPPRRNNSENPVKPLFRKGKREIRNGRQHSIRKSKTFILLENRTIWN